MVTTDMVLMRACKWMGVFLQQQGGEGERQKKKKKKTKHG